MNKVKAALHKGSREPPRLGVACVRRSTYLGRSWTFPCLASQSIDLGRLGNVKRLRVIKNLGISM